MSTPPSNNRQQTSISVNGSGSRTPTNVRRNTNRKNTSQSNGNTGNKSLAESAPINLSRNTGTATSNILNNRLSSPNSISNTGSIAQSNRVPSANLIGPNNIPENLLSSNRSSRGSNRDNQKSEESFLTNLFGSESPKSGNNKTNKSSDENSGQGSESNESGFLGNLFGDNTQPTNNSKSKKTTNGDTNDTVNNTNTSKARNEQQNNTLINNAKSTVSEGINTIKSAASGLANQVSHGLAEVADEAGGDSGNLMMTIFKIIIVLFVIIAVFFVARYLLSKYQDSVYSSPYLLEGSKNAKHALVISQDPANPSYVPMPKSDGQDGVQFTYDFWIMIESFEYKTGEWKHVFHKGNASSYPNRAPGVWIHPNTNALRVYMNTQDNILEYVDISNIPIRKWIHMSIILDDSNLDIYVNGYLKTRKLLSSVSKLNNGDFWCNMFGGFEGYLSRMRYYARAISPSEITENVRSGPGNSACIDTGQVPPYLDDDWWLS